ncbi:MAG: hypothetical protein NTV43_00940 [Methylococcales bacterium]|nr:hypothetical protein [Methylococcales bacterium]
MNNSLKTHSPAEPNDPTPSCDLLQILSQIEHPYILQKGITATSEGKWAIYITVPENVSIPIFEVESISKGFPVVYEVASEQPITPLCGFVE